jgi:hypothetical protein
MFATWTYGALVVVAGPSLTGWGASAGSVAAGVALSIVSLALATGAPAAVRAVETDPEPTAPLASPRLANEYAVHRHAKCTGYYWLTLAVVMWIALAVSAFLLTPTLPPSLVYALEASAFVIGALGSAFGLRLVAGRSRLRKILDALRAEAATA